MRCIMDKGYIHKNQRQWVESVGRTNTQPLYYSSWYSIIEFHQTIFRASGFIPLSYEEKWKLTRKLAKARLPKTYCYEDINFLTPHGPMWRKIFGSLYGEYTQLGNIEDFNDWDDVFMDVRMKLIWILMKVMQRILIAMHHLTRSTTK